MRIDKWKLVNNYLFWSRTMIRQDFFGCVNNVEGSLVMISTKALNKLLGSKDFERKNGTDEAETFVKKIIDAGGDIIDLDFYSGSQNFKVIKKFTVNNEGFNQTILEVHPSKLDMTRFLIKGELTRCEFFKKRIKELGLSIAEILEKGFSFRDEIMKEYKAIVKS